MLGGIGVEVQEVFDFWALRQLLGDAFQCDRTRETFGVDDLVGVLECARGFGAEVFRVTTDGHGVETAHNEVVHTHGEHVGWCVFTQVCATADHCEGTDVGELEKSGGATDNRVVFNDTFARDLDAIGHDDVVAEDATVCDVAVGHD